jgi:hypothetical protein
MLTSCRFSLFAICGMLKHIWPVLQVVAVTTHVDDSMALISWCMNAEFSEALQEMGTCLLKRVTPNKDGINGNFTLFSFFYRNMFLLMTVHVYLYTGCSRSW